MRQAAAEPVEFLIMVLQVPAPQLAELRAAIEEPRDRIRASLKESVHPGGTRIALGLPRASLAVISLPGFIRDASVSTLPLAESLTIA